jgi:hypothetical protein
VALEEAKDREGLARQRAELDMLEQQLEEARDQVGDFSIVIHEQSCNYHSKIVDIYSGRIREWF